MLDVLASLNANSSSHVRRHNRRVLLHALRLSGTLSRAELARATRLTPQAVANIVEDLIGAGLVREAGRRKSPRGQPPIAIEIAKDGGYAIGVRIDDTHFHAVAADLGGDIIETREGPSPGCSNSGWLDFLTGIHGSFAARYGAGRCLGVLRFPAAGPDHRRDAIGLEACHVLGRFVGVVVVREGVEGKGVRR